MLFPVAPASSALAERMRRRLELERTAEKTGKSFRPNARYQKFEDAVVRPALRGFLQATGLYRRGTANALQPQWRELSLAWPHLPPAFDGFRLLHLSDFHIDCLPELADSVAALLREVPCDLCAMTGDYRFAIEGSTAEAVRGMRLVIDSIRSEHGILGILGNHDSCEMAPALDSMGVQMLINDAVEIRRGDNAIWFAGVDDPHDYRCDDLAAAVASVPNDAFSVLLAHTPDLYAEAQREAFDLYLCGHTHAGQIRLPLVGSVMQNSKAPRAYTHGHWQHEGMHGYTSAGIGSSMLPVRFLCPPELVIITLRRA